MELWKDLSLRFRGPVMFFLPHVDPDLDISFEKIVQIVQIDCIWKTPFAHYALGDGGFMQSLPFFNILNGDLYLNALIIRLFQIYLGMGQTLREGTL